MNLLTRRFPTVLGLLLLTMGAVGTWWYFSRSGALPSPSTTPAKVRITNVADNKFSVSWVTSEPTQGRVEYGPVGDKLTQIAVDDRDQESNSGEYITHHVTVEGLQPETQYAFRLVSGSGNARFDNNGSPYSVATGPTITQTPPAESLYGDVEGGSGQSAHGALVYLALPGAAPLSTLVTTSSKYSFPLSTMRTSDLSSYIQYDSKATVANITVESGTQESIVTVTTANAAPVPQILLGQNADFRSEQPPIAQVEPQAPSDPSPSPVAETPTIFNVEPLSTTQNRTSSSADDVVLLNPEKEGEQVATTKPEFRGVGPESTVLSITVHSSKPYSDTVVVEDDGTWSWTPPADLEPGEHTVTIAYIDEAGREQSIIRRFFVSSVMAANGDPAFVSTPSASVRASASPSPIAQTPSPTPFVNPSPTSSAIVEYDPNPSASAISSSIPREVIPSTESGVPVTGVLTPTLLTGAIGLVIMVLGALMLAL